jgi:hypothetical protein
MSVPKRYLLVIVNVFWRSQAKLAQQCKIFRRPLPFRFEDLLVGGSVPRIEMPILLQIGYSDGAVVSLLRRFRGALEAAAPPLNARARNQNLAGEIGNPAEIEYALCGGPKSAFWPRCRTSCSVWCC